MQTFHDDSCPGCKLASKWDAQCIIHLQLLEELFGHYLKAVESRKQKRIICGFVRYTTWTIFGPHAEGNHSRKVEGAGTRDTKINTSNYTMNNRTKTGTHSLPMTSMDQDMGPCKAAGMVTDSFSYGTKRCRDGFIPCPRRGQSYGNTDYS